MPKKTKSTVTKGLTAQTLRRTSRYSNPVLEGILASIQHAAKSGQAVHSMPKGTPRILKELTARGFHVEDYGMTWHITWGTNGR